MEQKLEAYRKKKRESAASNRSGSLFKRILSRSEWSEPAPMTSPKETSSQAEPEEQNQLIENVSEDLYEERIEEIRNEEEEVENRISYLRSATYSLYFLLYVTLYLIAIQIEFGAVYFIISSLFLIYMNTRTKPKIPGEVSAYSVFNPNCEAIDGTLNAEQFEREIRFGAL